MLPENESLQFLGIKVYRLFTRFSFFANSPERLRKWNPIKLRHLTGITAN